MRKREIAKKWRQQATANYNYSLELSKPQYVCICLQFQGRQMQSIAVILLFDFLYKTSELAESSMAKIGADKAQKEGALAKPKPLP